MRESCHRLAQEVAKAWRWQSGSQTAFALYRRPTRLLRAFRGYSPAAQVIDATIFRIAVDPFHLPRRPFAMMPAPHHIEDRKAPAINADCLPVFVRVPCPLPADFHYIIPSIMPLPYLKRTFRFEIGHRTRPPIEFPTLKAEHPPDRFRRWSSIIHLIHPL